MLFNKYFQYFFIRPFMFSYLHHGFKLLFPLFCLFHNFLGRFFSVSFLCMNFFYVGPYFVSFWFLIQVSYFGSLFWILIQVLYSTQFLYWKSNLVCLFGLLIQVLNQFHYHNQYFGSLFRFLILFATASRMQQLFDTFKTGDHLKLTF